MIKEVPGWPEYFCDSDGNFYSHKHKSINEIGQELSSNGYLRVTFCVNGKPKKLPAHRMVLITMLGNAPPGKPQVNHKNGIKTDNRIENIEWCSHAYNQYHWCNVLNKKRVGVELPWTKLNESEVLKIREEYQTSSSRKLAKKYSVNKSTILRIVKNKTWAHLSK